ncbi:LapA family protein [Nordella sp. HKS 07]|uniref:lipopolysaccharide assembly protein LapA domain-containing protein n=1 Tax=Nordella sp. HKS 07 TaxID=2712222 RepID=UPI0013E1D27C|nr:LapA family protein [Nordella sp. HKS 07]QIG48706.1 LapA family protein [Nordella sp. HKS 07]
MTFRRAINWAIGLPIVIIVIAFCVANRQWIEVSFDPFSRAAPLATMFMPLWALFFAGIFFGLIAGWIACWFAQAKWRRAARQARIDLQRAQDEAQRFKREHPELLNAPPPAP